MELERQIRQTLTDLAAGAATDPHTVTWTAENGAVLEIDFTTVERLSCAFRELRLGGAPRGRLSREALQAWGDAVCRYVTYLLEPLALLELDQLAQAALIRSSPPTKDREQIAYYEARMSAEGGLTWRRYERGVDSPDVRQVSLELTHEALLRLVRDLIEALPAREVQSAGAK